MIEAPSGSTNAVLVRVVGDLFDQRLNPYFAKLANYFENPQSWRAAHAEHEEIRHALALSVIGRVLDLFGFDAPGTARWGG